MKRKMRILPGILAMLTVLIFAPQAWAEESAGAGEQGATIFFKWTHLVIIVGLLVYVVRTFGRPYFRSKADTITAAIGKATAAKAEAERLLKEAEAKLASLEQEVAQFQVVAQKEAAAELQRLRAMMKLDAEKIGLAAKAEIEAAERAARVELKALAANLAVDRAQSMVARELTPALQEAVVNHFVQNLQGRPN